MDTGKVSALFTTVVVVFSFVTSSSGKALDQQWSSQQQQSALSNNELHPIDNCIFACDHCFKEDALVRCANACILSEALLGSEWTSLCPYLSRQYTHPSLFPNNPFRH